MKTRFATANSPRIHIGVVTGKRSDEVIACGFGSALWELGQGSSRSATGRLYSDELIAVALSSVYEQTFKVSTIRKGRAKHQALCIPQDVDVIVVLETEEWLGKEQRYEDYRRLYSELRASGKRVIPDVSTMEFVYSKWPYLERLLESRFALPTMCYENRQDTALQLGQRLLCWVASWPGEIRKDTTRFVMKPSHSGSGRDILIVDSSALKPCLMKGEVVAELGKLHAHVQRLLQIKPYVLFQPYARSLVETEYRLYFVKNIFLGGIATGKSHHEGLSKIAVGQLLNVRRLSHHAGGDGVPELVEFGQEVVERFLPKSLLWRIDVFRYLGGMFVNEVEMLDAQLFLDCHEGSGERLLEAIVHGIAEECEEDGISCEKDKNNGMRRCPQGHTMECLEEAPEVYKEADRGLRCDVCRTDLLDPKGALHCSLCEYDVCSECQEKPRRKRYK